jgi:hypothetical protein
VPPFNIVVDLPPSVKSRQWTVPGLLTVSLDIEPVATICGLAHAKSVR